ncbi:MAG: hypothetical protein ABIJ46_02540 [bacterium]
MSSVASSPAAMVAALKAFDRLGLLGGGQSAVWTGTDQIQTNWINEVYGPLSGLVGGIPEIVVNATIIPAEHVAFLAEHGWQAQITEGSPEDVFTAGILDALVKWLTKGQVGWTSAVNGNRYPSFTLGREGLTCRSSSAFEGDTFFEVRTQNGDIVRLVETRSAPSDWVELAQMCREAVRRRQSASEIHGVDGVRIPMVDLSVSEELAQLVGMRTQGRWYVARACQQARLRMNEEGARAQAAVEMLITRGGGDDRNILTIDQPFIVELVRHVGQLEVPLFQAFVDYDAWKAPADLG